MLNLIPGDFNGDAIKGKYLAINLLNDPVIDSTLISNKFSGDITSSKIESNSLNIQPKNVKFGRISVVGIDVKEKKVLGCRLEKPLDKAIMLVYFDQAASIKGKISLNGIIANHDIQINEAGLHALDIIKLDEKNYNISATNSRASLDFDLTVKIKDNVSYPMKLSSSIN